MAVECRRTAFLTVYVNVTFRFCSVRVNYLYHPFGQCAVAFIGVVLFFACCILPVKLFVLPVWTGCDRLYWGRPVLFLLQPAAAGLN